MDNDNFDDAKFTDSPIEGIFGIEPGTTLSKIQTQKSELSEVPENIDDNEDKEIKSQLTTVYDYALEAFEEQSNMVDQIDPKFAARNAEVAAQYLKIALDTVNVRSGNKKHKDKMTAAEGKGPSTVNQNLVVADRNDVLKSLLKNGDGED